MAKAPSIQFYPGDWQRDTGLKMCSLAARGLWAEMMWLMFDGEPYGHLSVKGSDIPPDKLAVIVGVPLSVVEALLAELEKYGVFSRTPHGVIYSRRMVNDWNRRQTNAANGSKGGNPRLSKSVNRKDKGKDIPLTADAVADSSTVLNSSEKERAGAKARGPNTEVQAVIDYLIQRLNETDVAADIAETKQDRRFAAHSIVLAMRKRWPDMDPVTNAKTLIDAALANDFHRRHAMKLRYLLKHLDTIRLDAKASASNPKTQSDEERKRELAAEALRRFGSPV